MTEMRSRIATYRLQLRNGVTFARTAELVPYLKALGVSHLYLSPIFKAREGSTHGYDVVEPATIDPALGGEAGFAILVQACRVHDLGILLDIVPNHLGIGPDNPWWWDLLKNGPGGFGGRVFDVDWQATAGGTPGKLLLPILGDPLAEVIARGELVVEQGEEACLRYFEHRLPLAGNDTSGPLEALLQRQHYRLGWWRSGNAMLNWRRFFDVNELAGMCMEDPEVFDAVHARILSLAGEGAIDGLRLDHIDGLADPSAYLKKLEMAWKARIGRAPWLLVEKITGPGEALPEDWSVAGTTGYEPLNAILRLVVDSEGLEHLNRTFARFGGDAEAFLAIASDAKRQILAHNLRAELDRLVLRLTRHALVDIEPGRLRQALIDGLRAFSYYRSYGDTHRDKLLEAFASIPDRTAAAALERALNPGSDLLTSLEQLSGPAMAKSLEDTAFYRWFRLSALNEVGGEPHRGGIGTAEFHALMARRAESEPFALTATATHDTKRGEDTRLRIASLTWIPDAWDAAVTAWDRRLVGLGFADLPEQVRYFIYQTVIGVYSDDPALADRLKAYAVKAMREGKEHSHWYDPSERFETLLSDAIDGLLGDRELQSGIERLVRQVQPLADHASLAQTLLKLTLPGIPDIYQGTELADLSLVDPDNRRPVDFAHLASFPRTAAKQQLMRQVLAIRARYPDLFSRGGYLGLDAPKGRLDFRRQWQGQGATIRIRLTPAAAQPQLARPAYSGPAGSIEIS